MELRTEIKIPGSLFKIDHHQQIYLTGSCFSENILEKFKYFGFKVKANSHGIIYNPVSIYQCLSDLATEKKYTVKDLELYEGRYYCYNHHGSFSSEDGDELTERINTAIQTHREFVKHSSVVFVTLGTAWVYRIPERDLIVANCHKMPSKTFTKSVLSSEEIESNLSGIILSIHQLNPKAKIVFTLSPVKHLNDGFVENQLSKALLHVAIQKQRGENVHYFPSYEVMNDDLRDYRFWKEDMIHPNQLAIDYIWEKLSQTYFTDTTQQLVAEVGKLQQFLNHRPLTTDEGKIQQLNDEKRNKKTEFLKKHPQLNL